MKKFLPALAVILIISACSEETPNLELFSAEAFAYSLEAGWELNASVYAKGFKQEETDDIYTAKLSYVINLISPLGDTLEMVDYGVADPTGSERLIDTEIESQIELDSAFAIGQYKIIFVVTDDLTGQETKTEKTFELTKE